jgi:ribosomal protein S27AE
MIYDLFGVFTMSSPEEEKMLCPNCGNETIHIEEMGKYYCFSCNEYYNPPAKVVKKVIREVKEPKLEPEARTCPNCGGDTTYIEDYKSYYCYTCNDYIQEIERKLARKKEEKAEEVPQTIEPEEEKIPEPVAVAQAEDLKEEEPEDEAVKEEMPEEEGLKVEEPIEEETKEAEKTPSGKRKRKYRKYRYRTRLLKGSFLPILFGIISIQMLNRTVYEFQGYYEYGLMIILMGFLLGFGTLSGIVMVYLVRAKKNGKKGCDLNINIGVIAFLPFIIILLILVFFYSISTAWRFGTGFFLAAIFPFLFVTLYEAGSKGKFFVREMVDDPSKGRKLIFIQ